MERVLLGALVLHALACQLVLAFGASWLDAHPRLFELGLQAFAQSQILGTLGVLAFLLHRAAGWRWLPGLAAVFALGWTIEAIGLATGVPFGGCVFTDLLGWKLPGGVPLRAIARDAEQAAPDLAARGPPLLRARARDGGRAVARARAGRGDALGRERRDRPLPLRPLPRALALARLGAVPRARLAVRPRARADAPGPERGIGFLCQPSEAFALLILAIGSVIAARWSTEIFHLGIPLASFRKEVGFFAVLMTLLGIIPLLPFTGHLFRLRLHAIREYGTFARDYCARFDRKWLRKRRPDAEVLGTPDLQSLADLSHSFSVIERTRPLLITPRLPVRLAFAALLPMIPLFTTEVPLEELLPKLLKALG